MASIPSTHRRYFLRVVILRRLADISVEREIAVRTLSHFPDASSR